MASRVVFSSRLFVLQQPLVRNISSQIFQNKRCLLAPSTYFIDYKYPLLINTRSKSKTKSKGNHKFDSISSESLSDELKGLLNEAAMQDDFRRVINRFEEEMFRKLCLKLTPEHFFNILIPKEGVRLGEVANVISQTSVTSSTSQPTAQVLIDLSGRPDLVLVARNAVAQFLSDGNSEGSKKSSTSSDLIESVGQTQFTVRLRTIVTGEARKELAKQGREMLTRTKKETDKVYQKYSKTLNAPAMKTLSEDKKRLLNEYLKAVVKKQHNLAEETWKKKEQELLNE